MSENKNETLSPLEPSIKKEINGASLDGKPENRLQIKTLSLSESALQTNQINSIHKNNNPKSEETNVKVERFLLAFQSPDPLTVAAAIRGAAAIKNDERIVAGLAELLQKDDGYVSIVDVKTNDSQGDVIIEPVSILAAKTLAEIVPSGPTPPIGYQKKYFDANDVKKWRIWWNVNQGSKIN